MRWEQLLLLLVFLIWPMLQELAKKRARDNAARETSLENDEFDDEELPDWFPKPPTAPRHVPQQQVPQQSAPQPYIPQPMPEQQLPQPYTPQYTPVERPVYTAPYIAPPPVPTSPPIPVRVGPQRPLARVPTKSPMPSPKTIRATLKSREGFRQAMIHKIVLGQPRSMRPHN